MILYHGSKMVVPAPLILQQQYTKDFGPGFYCTNSLAQAQKWALHKSAHPEQAIVNRYQYTPNQALQIQTFPQMSEEWLDFVVACRTGTPHHFDIVEGPMADDQIWEYVEDFLRGDISREAFWILAKFRIPTHQISFHSPDALACLSFLGGDAV